MNGDSMESYDLGVVIAERKLQIEADGNAVVTVSMGTPQKFGADENAYYVCPIQIRGLGDEKVRGAKGVDAFQALQLGMQLIGIELYVKLNPKCDGKLRWNGEAYLSFPLPESVADFGPPRN
jgi:hypothetical protein